MKDRRVTFEWLMVMQDIRYRKQWIFTHTPTPQRWTLDSRRIRGPWRGGQVVHQSGLAKVRADCTGCAPPRGQVGLATLPAVPLPLLRGGVRSQVDYPCEALPEPVGVGAQPGDLAGQPVGDQIPAGQLSSSPALGPSGSGQPAWQRAEGLVELVDVGVRGELVHAACRQTRSPRRGR